MSLGLFPAISQAAENEEMSIYPYEWDGNNELTKYWYIYNLDVDSTHEDKVVVENTGDTPISVKIYPVDALTTSDGAFALENEDEEKNDIGAWVTLSKNELELAAGQKEEVTFSVKIPADATVGEHIGGIILENKKIMEGQQINVKTRVGVRIYETIPGEIVKKLSIDDITAKGLYKSILSIFYNWNFDYKVTNLGNVQINPKISSKLTSSIFGNVEDNSQTINGSIFPGKSVDIKFNPTSSLYFGPYKLVVTTQLDDQAPIQKSINFWVIPWKLLIITIIVLLSIFSILFLDHHKPNTKNETYPEIAVNIKQPKAKKNNKTTKKSISKTKPKSKKSITKKSTKSKKTKK
jgi:hypothetical protein